ncbi:ThuA domain-containing protein [Novosphingobium sp. ERW19]|uniref:ThuA domain-containing protein n=1 Tax=Novosphingobium sp. ERW19 TaxID=2726186 RepID=UPI0014577B07|nr:ThuA domain-containing protein [Novosphingobium sp. ERW19]NLR41624.1 ThuA domain-containing protein [Novosphingobium sp. ERW19]
MADSEIVANRAEAGVGRLRLVIYSGGYKHPFVESTAALLAIARRVGLEVAICADLSEALAKLRRGQDILAVNALRWSMTQADRFAADRPTWGGALSDDEFAAISGHVDDGGGLLAMHTAVICWDNQPGWRTLLGGGWTWDHSHHPPLGKFTVRVVLALAAGPDAAGPDAAGPDMAQFDVIDEAYHNLDPATDCEIVALAEAGQEPQPVIWRRRQGAGRIVVDALGHDARSLTAPGHVTILKAMLAWLSGQ